MWHSVAVWVVQCGAVWCSVVQYVAVCYSVLQSIAVCNTRQGNTLRHTQPSAVNCLAPPRRTFRALVCEIFPRFTLQHTATHTLGAVGGLTRRRPTFRAFLCEISRQMYIATHSNTLYLTYLCAVGGLTCRRCTFRAFLRGVLAQI